MSQLAFIVVGHVDHGKSTLVGRLLADTGALQDGRVEKIQRICQEQRKRFEYAFLLDALEEEQLQGVTIDITEARFRWQDREYLVIDAPGHQEFIKNMISGAAHADAALLLVDAKEGVQEQSRRHAYLLSFLGIRQIAVVVSKMDLVEFSQTIFDRVTDDYTAVLTDLGLQPVAFIPVAASEGDNVTVHSERLPWYHGPSVLEVLRRFTAAAQGTGGPLRIPVQDVYKFDDRRIIAGRIEGGCVRVGDEVQVWPSGHRARVSSLESWPPAAAPPTTVTTRQSVGLILDYPLFIQRGDVLADPANPPQVSNFVAANIFWLGRAPLVLNREYKLKLVTSERTAEVFSIARVMNAASMHVEHGKSELAQNEAGEVVFRTARPLVFDPAAAVPETGRFVILDGHDVVGGGIIQEAEELYRRSYRHGLPKSAGISPMQSGVTIADRAVAYGHQGHVVWLTGVPGVGKSTLARHLERELFDRHVKTFVLDGENLRFGLSADLGFTDADRSEQARRAGEVARLFRLAGFVVIVALVSPFDADREYARTLVGPESFSLIHLEALPAILRERDPHGLYSRAAGGAAVAVPGLNSPYERPVGAALQVDTGGESIQASGARILELVLPKISAPPAARTSDRDRPGVSLASAMPSPSPLPGQPTRQPRGCCVWLTGLSGAGKSTIAEALIARLKEHGREVTFLDGDVVRTHLSKGLGFSREDRDANVKRIGFVAGEVVRHGGVAICAVVSPYDATREECRGMIGADRFVLVHVSTPLDICEQRDPKGMYARARRGEIRDFTGIDDPYEPPARPDVVLTTTGSTPDESARMILSHLERHDMLESC
jgi:bifunctional enzyme CysN/CysC